MSWSDFTFRSVPSLFFFSKFFSFPFFIIHLSPFPFLFFFINLFFFIFLSSSAVDLHSMEGKPKKLEQDVSETDGPSGTGGRAPR